MVRSSWPTNVLIGLCLFAVGAAPSQAVLIWEGDPAQGLNVFKNVGPENYGGPRAAVENCVTGTLSPVQDATRGLVWRYHKPSDSYRCENHGIRVNGDPYRFSGNSLYYLGWWNRLSTTADNNANFQWKSWGDGHIQNYPVILKMISGRQTLQYRAPGENCCRTLWSRSISANTWNHQVLALYTSTSAGSGWIEFWFNGARQTLTNGSTRYYARTWDTGDHNCPKWGIYGGTGLTMNNYADDLRIGTTLADVGPQGGAPTPTPTPCPGCTFSGYYRLTARHSGKAVVVQSASTADGGNVIQWTYGGTNANDEWELRGIGSGYYRVINRHSGKDLVVQSASTAEGANIFQWTYGGTNTNDEWAIVDVGGGYFRITNRNGGRSAEVAGGSTSDGANVAQRTYSGAAHQQFQVVGVP